MVRPPLSSSGAKLSLNSSATVYETGAPWISRAGKRNLFFPSLSQSILSSLHSVLERAPRLLRAPPDFVGTLRRVLTLSERPGGADAERYKLDAAATVT